MLIQARAATAIAGRDCRAAGLGPRERPQRRLQIPRPCRPVPKRTTQAGWSLIGHIKPHPATHRRRAGSEAAGR